MSVAPLNLDRFEIVCEPLFVNNTPAVAFEECYKLLNEEAVVRVTTPAPSAAEQHYEEFQMYMEMRKQQKKSTKKVRTTTVQPQVEYEDSESDSDVDVAHASHNVTSPLSVLKLRELPDEFWMWMQFVIFMSLVAFFLWFAKHEKEICPDAFSKKKSKKRAAPQEEAQQFARALHTPMIVYPNGEVAPAYVPPQAVGVQMAPPAAGYSIPASQFAI